jgi:hypothetical protein
MAGSLVQPRPDTVGISFSEILLRVCYHCTQFGQRHTAPGHCVRSLRCHWNLGIIKKFASAQIGKEIFSRLMTIYDR